MRIELEVDSTTGKVEIISKTHPRAAEVDGDAPFGRDPFGTPYESEADRARMENLMRYSAAEAANYTGAIDPDTLGLYDWAFYVKSGLWRSGAKDYSGFTKKPIPRDPATGRTLMNPEAEFADVDVSAYGGPLKALAP